MVNVTPNTPPALPILYTYMGQVYELESLSNLGCVDTVFTTTSNTTNGTTTYSQYAVAPAQTALNVLASYNGQFQSSLQACASLISQVPASTAVATQADPFVQFLNDITSNFWQIVEAAIVIIVIVGVGMWVLEKVGIVKRRGR